MAHQQNRQSEYAEQSQLVAWVRSKAPRVPQLRWFHSSLNGESLSKGQAIKAKRAGMVAGVPDLFLPFPVAPLHGLYLEMKTYQGKMSKEQKEFKEWCLEVGYGHALPRSWHEGVSVITAYLKGEWTNDQ